MRDKRNCTYKHATRTREQSSGEPSSLVDPIGRLSRLHRLPWERRSSTHTTVSPASATTPTPTVGVRRSRRQGPNDFGPQDQYRRHCRLAPIEVRVKAPADIVYADRRAVWSLWPLLRFSSSQVPKMAATATYIRRLGYAEAPAAAGQGTDKLITRVSGLSKEIDATIYVRPIIHVQI